MIENETKLDEKDLRYLLNRKLYSRWFNVAFRILFFLIAIGAIILGVLKFIANNSEVLYGLCYIVLGIFLFGLNLYLYNVYIMNKFKDIIKFDVSKNYIIEKKYIKFIEKLDKKEVKTQITFKQIKKATIKTDRIYLYYNIGEELEVISIHDDGYKILGKNEVIDLLKNKHIKIKNMVKK